MVKLRIGVICVVPDCLSAYYPGCKIRFHPFPKNDQKRNKWVKSLRLSPNDDVSTAMVCQYHFGRSDFCKNDVKNVKWMALPQQSRNRTFSGSNDSDVESIDIEKALKEINEDSSSELDSNVDINEELNLTSSDEEIEKKVVKKKQKASKRKVVSSNFEDGERRDIDIGQHEEDAEAESGTGNDPAYVCRTCLAVGCKMYSIKKFNMEQTYLLLTGLTAEMYDETKMPQMLCYECVKKLKNFVEFSTRSLTAWSLLMELIEENKLTMDSIKSINREQNLLSSKLSSTIFKPNHFDIQVEEEIEDISNDFKYTQEKGDDEKENSKTDDFADTYSDFEDETEQPYITPSEDNLDASQNPNKYVLSVTNGYIDIKPSNYESSNGNRQATRNQISSDDDELNSPDEETANETDYERYKLNRINRRDDNILDYNKIFKVTKMTPEFQKAELENRKNSKIYKVSIYKCHLCYRGFNYEAPFAEHMKRHSPESGDYVCVICQTHYKSRSKLTSHFRQRHDLYVECRLCPFKTAFKASASAHKMFHEGSRYKCKKCPRTFAKANTFRYHLQKRHPEDAVCHLCGESFVGILSLLKHLRSVHKGQDIKMPRSKTRSLLGWHSVRRRESSLPYSLLCLRTTLPETSPYCSSCDIRFLDNEALENHLGVSPNHGNPPKPVNKPLRRSLPDDEQNLTCEQLLANSPYCPLCDIRFRDVESLRVHIEVTPNHENVPITVNVPKRPQAKVNRKPKPPSKPFTCEQCGHVCETHRLYINHFRDSHPGVNRTQYPASRPAFMCEQCGKIYQNITMLNEHRVGHTGARPHSCEKCGATFATKHVYRIHMQNHTKSRRCKLCGRGFASVGGLMRHVRIHTGKPYACEPCNKRFCTPSARREHIRHFHMGVPWPKKRPKGEAPLRHRGGKFQSDADIELDVQSATQG